MADTMIVAKGDEQPVIWHWVITLQWSDRFSGVGMRTMNGTVSVPSDSTASERYGEISRIVADQVGQAYVVVFYLCELEVIQP